MEERVHFFSTYDLSIPMNLERADTIIKNYKDGWRPKSIDDIIELYNIWLFVENGVQKKDWGDEMLDLIKKKFKTDIVYYFSKLKKDTWTETFKQIEFDSRQYFWEIIDRFDIDGLIDERTLRDALSDNSWDLKDLLRNERLVKNHQQVIATLLKENVSAAEWLLQEFVEEDALHDHDNLYFPKTLTFQDREDIISRYLDSENANLNYVRLVMLAKKDSNLRLSDEVRLKAKRLEKKLNEEILTSGSVVHFKYAVCFSDEADKPSKWIERDEDKNPILCYSKQTIRKCSDEELLHYIRYVFEFLTPNGLIPFVSRISESDVLERIIDVKGKFAYQTNLAFRYYETISLLQVNAMQEVLAKEGRNLENALKVYYQQYLKNKYGFPSNTLSLANIDADWVTKCRSIAAEMDAIAQRYELYLKKGEIDEDLLSISSEGIRITSVSSANPIKYYAIKGEPDTLYRLFHLLFSDQSMLTFVNPFKKNRYHSFYQLLMAQDEKICYTNYHDYQQRDIDFLIEEGYLSKNEKEMLCVEKTAELGLLKILYEYHCCPFNAFDPYGQELLKEMEQKGWVEPDNHMLSGEERNYFDYYLYNNKYTNSRALRNRYMHGSNVDASKEEIHHNAYNRLLILLILELLKIEDDLIQQKMIQENKLVEEHESEFQFLIGAKATIGTCTQSRVNEIIGDYLILPKKLGLKDGYIYDSNIPIKDNRVYYIHPKGGCSAEYISFLMNSMPFRTILSKATNGDVSLTIEKIKSISLPWVSLEKQRLFAKLEHLIALLMAKGNDCNRDESLQLNMFSSLRDYICLELFQGIRSNANMNFIEPFTEMMEQIEGNDVDLAEEIMNQLLSPSNVLMDNMKKARILLSKTK